LILTRRDTDNRYIAYFRNPLFGISASSAYGLPNSLTHFPVVLMISYIGIIVCGQSAKPLLPVYFIIALYVARDMVVMAYKNPSVPAAVWALFIPVIIYKKEISAFLAPGSQRFSIYVTAAFLGMFVFYMVCYIYYFLKWRD